MVENTSAEGIVREFWRLMGTNDFDSVKAVLAPEFLVEWPQSGERIRGPDNFARLNAEYPTSARWRFDINRMVACGDEVVTQVSVTDGIQAGEPISFFTVRDGRIVRLLEYWPEPFAPAENRRHLVEQPEDRAESADGGASSSDDQHTPKRVNWASHVTAACFGVCRLVACRGGLGGGHERIGRLCVAAGARARLVSHDPIVRPRAPHAHPDLRRLLGRAL